MSGDNHRGITGGIHDWNRRSPKGIRDDSPQSIHLTAECFAKRGSLEQLGGDKTTTTCFRFLRGKDNLLKLPVLSYQSGNPIFHHLNLFLVQRCSLFLRENLMAIRTDEQVVTPIRGPDIFSSQNPR